MSRYSILIGLVACLPLLDGCGAPAQLPRASTSAAPQRLWVEPARAYGDTVWFPDEMLVVQDAVASVLARPPFGYQVIPNAEVRALWAATQQGRLPGVALRCEAAPPPSLLTEVVYPGARKAEVETRCDKDGCRLEVRIQQPNPDAEQGPTELARFELPLARGQTPSQWAQTIASTPWKTLPPPDPSGGLGIGGLLAPGAKPGVYVVLHDLTQTGPWLSKLESATFQPMAESIKACAASKRTWRDWWGQEFVIEVTPAGKVSRCEYPLVDHLPPPDFECTCGLLRAMEFGLAQATRRASFYLDVTTLSERHAPAPTLYRSAYLLQKKATDRSAVLGTNVVDSAAVALCLESVDQVLGEMNIPVTFEVGADGRSTRHAVQWPQLIGNDVRACMDRELAKAWFNCPLTGRAQVTAVVSIAVKPYGKPIKVEKAP
ncbi:MAG: hypothetical protein HY898_18085 [Deltaproteobacteria bacterium]|nr:hypothetical protein [Deltaproteobacteria bacterium]